MTKLYNSNLDSEADGMPAGWAVGLGAGVLVRTASTVSQTVISGAKALYGADQDYSSVQTALGALTDQAIRTDQHVYGLTTAAFRAMGALLRSNAPEVNSYRVYLESNNTGLRLTIAKYQNGSTILASSSTYAFTPAPGDIVHFEARVTGSSPAVIEGRVWINSDARPATANNTATATSATVTASDSSSPYASGYVGQRFNGANAWGFADNIVITDAAGGEGFYDAADTTAPTLLSAAVANATPTIVNLTMSEAMDTGSVPAASAFTVSGHTVSSVAIVGSSINLTLAAPFVFGEAARTLSYTQPGTNNARDLATTPNLLANFSGAAITNNVAATDTTAPSVSSATVATGTPTQILVTFSETLGAFTPAAAAFAASGGRTVTGVSRSGATLTLTVNTAYASGDVITFDYTKPGSNPIQDAAGNQTNSFTGQTVTNNIGDTTAPTFSSAQVANAAPGTIVITMSEALAASTPSASAFAVSGGRSVTGVSISGATVSLTVNTPYANGDAITVTYSQPGANPRLQDAAANLTAGFGPSAVTNNVAPAPVGTVTIPPLVNNTGTPWASNTNVSINLATAAYPPTQLLALTGKSTDGSGNLAAIANAALYGQTTVRAYWKVDSGDEGMMQLPVT